MFDILNPANFIEPQIETLPSTSRPIPQIQVEYIPSRGESSEPVPDPLKIKFKYESTGQENTLYLQDSQILDLSLELSRQGDNEIEFLVPNPKTVSDTNYHFYLRFDKKINILLSPIYLKELGWQIKITQGTQADYIFFLRTENSPLTFNNYADKIVLTLRNLVVYDPNISQTDIVLGYGKNNDKTKINLELDGLLLSVQKQFTKQVNIIKKPEILLKASLIAHDTVLNDGTSPNNLTLKIFNPPLPNGSSPTLSFTAQSKLTIRFETGNIPEALTTDAEAKAVSIQVKPQDQQKWNVQKSSNETWATVTAKGSQELRTFSSFDLEISGLKTSKPSGIGYLYIDYENITGYPNGRLIVPVQKTPLLYRNHQVGIGINTPVAKLHIGNVSDDELGLIVEGPDAKTDTTKKEILRFVRPAVQSGANGDQISFKLGKFESGNLGKSQLDIALNNTTVMSLQENGKVGIGTTTPKIHLAIGDDDTGLQQQGDGKLAIYTNNVERVRIDSNGNVGIGTTSPSSKVL